MKRIFVTGGAGYIGSHACKALAKAGFEPVAFDNMESGDPDAVKWGPLEVGDIRDKERLLDALTSYRPDAVLHFSAYIQVEDYAANP